MLKHYSARIVSVDETSNTFAAQVRVRNDDGDIIEQYNGSWYYDDRYVKTSELYDSRNHELVKSVTNLWYAAKFFNVPMTMYIGRVGHWTL